MAGLGRADLVELPDLSHKVHERLVYVDSLLGRCLNELTAEVFREITALCGYMRDRYKLHVSFYVPFMPT